MPNFIIGAFHTSLSSTRTTGTIRATLAQNSRLDDHFVVGMTSPLNLRTMVDLLLFREPTCTIRRPFVNSAIHRSTVFFYTDSTNDHPKTIKLTINNFTKHKQLPPTAINLITRTPRISVIYCLPEMHKAGRPVVSACHCPTEQVSSF